MSAITHIVKRSGKRVLFNENKIVHAVLQAMEDAGTGTEKEAERVKNLVIKKLDKEFSGKTPNIENMQDLVEHALLELKYIGAAKAYIVYRNERSKLREQKAALIGGEIDDVELSLNGLKLLEQRYLQRDEDGKVTEKPSELFWRVANHVAMAELKYNDDPKVAARAFYRMMTNLEFLPASPTLMNAGTSKQLSACFAVPIEDNVDKIFKALHQAAVIHKNGGGTGFSFSRIRPQRDNAEGMPGVAAGPLAYMRVFEAGMRAVKQSGRRQGSNMGVLRVDHPDILDFINMKLTRNMENFNISVAITDKFMESLEKNEEYNLINPRTKKPTGTVSARVVFDSILAVSWRCGDPGLLFIDRINGANQNKHLGSIETTSSCGEQPLLPYESCNEGSINLVKCLKMNDGKWDVDIPKLRRITQRAVHFLDNVIDVNNYPIKETETVTKKTRKIGLGLMGFADVLYALRIPYDSEEAEQLAGKIIMSIQEEAEKTSEEIAERRGPFKGFRGSGLEKTGKKRRNGSITCLAPTGTISLIANVSSGIEPNFALAYSRTVAGGADMLNVNRFFEQAIEDNELLSSIAKRGGIAAEDELPEEMKAVFKTAHQIHPEWHIRIQAAFQKHVDGAISKTINFPANASVKDIEEGFLLAWKLGCKGVTVYRDSSLDTQVITAGG